MKSLGADPAVELLAADMDPWAAGLYLVPPAARTLIPAGAAPGFHRRRCLPGAGRSAWTSCCRPSTRSCGRWRAPARCSRRHGIDLLLAPAEALDVILDKLALAAALRRGRPRPADRAVRGRGRPGGVDVPGHRQAADGQRVARHHAGRLRRRTGRARALARPARAGVPARRGVLDRRARRTPSGHVIASVPRLRARVDSGVSVGGRTVHDAELSSFGRAVAEATGITYVANVQCKRDAGGPPRAARGEPADAGHARAHHRQRCRHAAARASPPCAASRCRPRSASASAPWSASSTSASSIRPTSPASGLT